MTPGLALTFWTVRLAAGLYALSLLGLLGGWRRVARLAWLLGCALLFVHVGLALHVVYGWDHAEMVRRTAEQARAMNGVTFAAAAYVNYAFMAVWAADAGYWLVAGDERYRRRARWLVAAVHAFMAFVVINAVVVFAVSAWTRWAGIAAAVGLGTAWACSRRQHLARTR
ncbi:MAG TPA: hypothetical protein VF796_11285 [Humisphaera sp.]